MTRRTRRAFLEVLGLVAAGAALGACGVAPATDFAPLFAGFAPADEPNADPGKVIWPDWIERADPEVKRLYEFQLVNGELMKYMPCFCGCGTDGHRNNRDCYIQEVKADGSVVFDRMAPN